MPAGVGSGSRSLTGTEVSVKQTNEAIAATVPPSDREAMDTIIALELEGAGGPG